jgi:hypothetical protein
VSARTKAESAQRDYSWKEGCSCILTSFCSGVSALQAVLELADALADVVTRTALAEEADDVVGCFCGSSSHFGWIIMFNTRDE